MLMPRLSGALMVILPHCVIGVGAVHCGAGERRHRPRDRRAKRCGDQELDDKENGERERHQPASRLWTSLERR
jgi:hypothetical protein